jgi:hypothetical protein
MATQVQQCVEKLSIKRGNIFSKLINSNFDTTHATKLENLCQILYGESSTIETTLDTKLFNNLIHLWFNTNSVIEELYHLFRLSGLCFLHKIFFTFELTTSYIKNANGKWSTSNNITSKSTVIMLKHVGKSNKISLFNPSKYKKSQIDNCQKNFMAIPFSFGFENNPTGHANILFIKVGEKKDEKIPVELERFEPHGSVFIHDEIKNNIINEAMQDLSNKLFPNQYYDVKPLVKPIDHCPNIKGLQNLTKDSIFEGSCTTFSMLYAILKLINPERSQSEIADDIHKILKKNNNPVLIVRLIINVLTRLLNITKEGDHYYIQGHTGKKRQIQTQTEENVNNWIKNVETISSIINSDKKYEGKFENGLFVEGTITFLNNSEPRKFYKGKVNKETMQMNDPNGELVWKNGNKYIGNFVDNKMTGKGIKIFVNKNVYAGGDWVYEGDFINGIFHGNGIMRYANGDVYEGEWKDDERFGKGIMRYANGDVYEGEWKDDERFGKGIMRYANGDVYEGEWKKIRFSISRYRYVNGDVYEKSGKGIMKYANGDVYEGEWKDNERFGKCIMRYANGDVYEGEWKNDKKLRSEGGKKKSRKKKIRKLIFSAKKIVGR